MSTPLPKGGSEPPPRIHSEILSSSLSATNDGRPDDVNPRSFGNKLGNGCYTTTRLYTDPTVPVWLSETRAPLGVREGKAPYPLDRHRSPRCPFPPSRVGTTAPWGFTRPIAHTIRPAILGCSVVCTVEPSRYVLALSGPAHFRHHFRTVVVGTRGLFLPPGSLQPGRRERERERETEGERERVRGREREKRERNRTQ